MRDQFRLTPARDNKGNLFLENGLIAFRLGLWIDGKEVDNLTVNSGAIGVQNEHNLRKFADKNSRPGSMEPIPEGTYAVGPVEWAVNNDFYSSWGAGLGPVWVDITPITQGGSRSAFGFHLDENRSFAPGSAGCIVFKNLTDLRKYLEMRKKYPKLDLLTVDYDLGSVTKPVAVSTVPKPTKEVKFKIFHVNNRSTLILLEDMKAGSYTMVSDEAGWTGKLVERA